jgi:hypothetical protein
MSFDCSATLTSGSCWNGAGLPRAFPCRTPPTPEIIRLTRGNFLLLARLLTQMERVLTINRLEQFSVAVLETSRENLVMARLNTNARC